MAPLQQPDADQSRKLTRRQFLQRSAAAGLSAAALGSLFALPAAAATTHAVRQAPTYLADREVSLWHIFSTLGTQEDAMNAVVKDFQQTHPGITVVTNEVQREDIKVLAPAVMRTSKAPDVIQYRVISTARVGYEAGLVLDISDLWAANNWEQQFGSLSANGKWKGKYWNIPWNIDSFPGFWY